MKTSDFYYDLPQRLIAQDPLGDRSASRLMTISREDQSIGHRTFRDLPQLLRPGDCLVLNDTRVIPARLIGEREETHGAVEVLLLKRTDGGLWECLVKPGRKCRPGQRLVFGDGALRAEIDSVTDGGNRLIRFEYEGIFEEILDRLGQMPLPPYITHKLEDPDRYQTVYARERGSAAAPTAGLHFTKELLGQLQEQGIILAHITLHVGLGTFRPVRTEEITDHHMHSEYYCIEPDQADRINEARRAGGRVICCGTTSCRTLESAADEDGCLKAGNGWTDIFIYPGYRFKIMDGLITNFHLPESTLLMLVSAFGGQSLIMDAYHEAIRQEYRFYSFGDAMLIL